MEPMESPNFLEHAELLDENTPHYLNAFHKYLIQHNMSPNTITAYIYSVRHFFTYFGLSISTPECPPLSPRSISLKHCLRPLSAPDSQHAHPRSELFLKIPGHQ